MKKIIFSHYKKSLFITILIFIFGSYVNAQSYTVSLPQTPEFEYLAISAFHPKLIGSTTMRTPMVYIWPEFESIMESPTLSLNRKTVGIIVRVRGYKIPLQATAIYCDAQGGVYRSESNICEICVQQVDPYDIQLMLSAKTKGGWVIEKGSVSINRTNINAPSNRTNQMSIPISRIFEITNCDVTYVTKVRFTIVRARGIPQATETPLSY